MKEHLYKFNLVIYKKNEEMNEQYIFCVSYSNFDIDYSKVYFFCLLSSIVLYM